MKHLILIAAAAVLASCSSTECKITAQGQPYEILVIIPTQVWHSAVGDTLQAIFTEPVAVSNQEEPRFTISSISSKLATPLLYRHRNIIEVNVSQDVPSIDILHDLNSKGQLYVVINAPDTASLTSLIAENSNRLLKTFENAEYERQLTTNKLNKNDSIAKLIADKFGFSITIPKEFEVVANGDNSTYIRHQSRHSTRGLIVYQNSELGEVFRQIPLADKGTYMVIDSTFLPIDDEGVTRGFWTTHGAFAGGVWAKFDVNNSDASILCFIYSPSSKENKRNLMYSLEAIAKSAQ